MPASHKPQDRRAVRRRHPASRTRVAAALLSVGGFLGAVWGMASARGSAPTSSGSTTSAATASTSTAKAATPAATTSSVAATPATTSTSTKAVTTTHAS